MAESENERFLHPWLNSRHYYALLRFPPLHPRRLLQAQIRRPAGLDLACMFGDPVHEAGHSGVDPGELGKRAADAP